MAVSRMIMNETKDRDLGIRLASTAFLALLVVSIAAGVAVTAYRMQKGVVRERTLQGLRQLVFFEQVRLADWFAQQKANARALLDLPALRALPPPDQPLDADSAKVLSEALDRFVHEKGYVAWALLGPDGQELPRLRGGEVARLAAPWLPLPATAEAPIFSGIRRSASGALDMDVLVPLRPSGTTGPPRWVLLAIDPVTTLFRLLAFTPPDLPSLETCLIQREGDLAAYATPMRGGAVPALSVHQALTETGPAAQALRGDHMTGEGVDYRGVPALYATSYVPWVPWGILGTVDERDAYASLRFSFLLGACFTLFATLSAVAFISAWWNRRNRLMAARHLAIVSEHKATLQDAVRGLFTAQEEERQRLSHELHDGLAQSLAVARMNASALEDLVPDPSAEEAQRVTRRLGQSLDDADQECRAIINRFRPPELERLGLARALKALAAPLEDTRVAFDLDEGALAQAAGPETSLVLFRIAQEALANIRKHAEASAVRVALRPEGEAVLLEIEDDGRGFDQEQVPQPLHFGLDGMRERARLAGGWLTVESSSGAGTRVHAHLPLHLSGREGERHWP